MPQEFQVLKCCDCQTYQVHLVKKLNKFNCKMCGKKQSTRQVYMKSFSGADCRNCVQKLNLKKGQETEKEQFEKQMEGEQQQQPEVEGDEEDGVNLAEGQTSVENQLEDEDDLPDIPLPSPQLESEEETAVPNQQDGGGVGAEKLTTPQDAAEATTTETNTNIKKKSKWDVFLQYKE